MERQKKWARSAQQGNHLLEMQQGHGTEYQMRLSWQRQSVGQNNELRSTAKLSKKVIPVKCECKTILMYDQCDNYVHSCKFSIS